MLFRYREMVYRPDFYHFHTEDRTEWFPNGIYNYNVSRMISDFAVHKADPNGPTGFLNMVLEREISVQDTIDRMIGLGKLKDEHIDAADLNRPVIYVEVSPDMFNLIDGHHRLAKAKKLGIEKITAYFMPAHVAIRYLGSEAEYCDYVKFWNSKVEDRQDCSYFKCDIPGLEAPYKDRDLDACHIWNRLAMCLNECRRVELYSEDDEWFTLFRLNGKLYCGEAEDHPSIRCNTPFAIESVALQEAVNYFEEWYALGLSTPAKKELRKTIRKQVKHANVLMTCIRVFSEY